jgi:hypothetical protein
MILTIFYQHTTAFTIDLCHIDKQCHLGIHVTYPLMIIVEMSRNQQILCLHNKLKK